jgi:hypothetical protein
MLEQGLEYSPWGIYTCTEIYATGSQLRGRIPALGLCQVMDQRGKDGTIESNETRILLFLNLMKLEDFPIN